MANIQKIKVLVLDEYTDDVLRSLGEAGTAQIANLKDSFQSWKGLLDPYEVPAEEMRKSSNLRSRTSASVVNINEFIEAVGKEGREIEISIGDVDQELSEKELSGDDKIRLKLNGILREVKVLVEELREHVANREVTSFGQRLVDMEELLRLFEKDIDGPISISEIKPRLEEVNKYLLSIEETLDRVHLCDDVKSSFGRTEKTVYFEAYVPTQQTKDIIDRIRRASDDNCLITEETPSFDERVPTIKKLAPSFLMAFEKLTLAAGYPSTSEVNPIPIMALTFPLLFGFMFADVGQGIIFLILGGVLTYFRRKIKLQDVGDIYRYLLSSGELFILMGIFAIFFGFLFGEFFGSSGVIHPISLGKLGPFYFGGFEPTHEPMKMLRLAIFFGVVHLGLGMVLRAINEVKRRHFKLVPVPICWLWLLLGGLWMWSYWGGISNISSWFAEGVIMLVGAVVSPLILIIVFTGLAEGFMEGIGFGVEVFAETLSHTLSYGRLMALGLVHGVFNNLFLVLGGVSHGHFPVSSIPLIAIGTILVLTIEGLIVFVHSLRLHWIEWFSKFYVGEGIPFKPFHFIFHKHTIARVSE